MTKQRKPQSPLEALMSQMAVGNLDTLSKSRPPKEPVASHNVSSLETNNPPANEPLASPAQSRKPANSLPAPPPAAPSTPISTTTSSSLMRIHWSHIRPWSLADRPDNEFGDMDGFIQDIKLNGQHTPIIVRSIKTSDSEAEYEFIVGNRRWNAAKELDSEVLCIARSLSDEQAFAIMHSENDDREDISPWAKGISFSRAIEEGAFKSARALAAKIGKGHSYINDLLIYSRIPTEIAVAIGPMTKVSQNTAKTVCQLASENSNNLSTLIELAPRIAHGLAKASLIKELKKLQGSYIDDVITLKGKGGNYCTLRADSNGTPVFSLLKDARNFLDNDAFQLDLIKLIDQHYEKCQPK